jgi:hypothetical protein
MADVPIVPVTPGLEAALRKAVAEVPIDKTLQANASITNRGVGASFGWKPRPSVSIGGYAAKLWGGGYEAGARIQFIR